jgi:hypothetical protein
LNWFHPYFCLLHNHKFFWSSLFFKSIYSRWMSFTVVFVSPTLLLFPWWISKPNSGHFVNDVVKNLESLNAWIRSIEADPPFLMQFGIYKAIKGNKMRNLFHVKCMYKIFIYLPTYLTDWPLISSRFPYTSSYNNRVQCIYIKITLTPQNHHILKYSFSDKPQFVN